MWLLQLTQCNSVSIKIDEYPYKRHDEESYHPISFPIQTLFWSIIAGKLTRILQNTSIPTRGNRIRPKSDLRQLGCILGKHNRRARLKQTKQQHAPENPRHLDDLAELEFFVTFAHDFAGGGVRGRLEAFIGDACKEVESNCHDIGEEIHEYRRPEYPGEITGLFGDDVGG